jgi:hypothetical protein
MPDLKLEALEGRLMAQRKLIALLVAELDRDGRADRLWAFLDERSQFQDGEEDPGVVPSGALATEGAVSDEVRLIAEAARRYARS